jgi:hypothetical protein
MGLMGARKAIQLGVGRTGTWTNVYEWPSTPVLDAGWSTYTFVATIAAAQFNRTGGTRCRITFEGISPEGFIANSMYVGNGGGGDAFDFGDTPVQVFMGGTTTITVPAGTTVVTDDFPFVKDATNPMVVAMSFSGSSNDNLARTNTSAPGANSYYKNSVSEASLQNKTGYTSNFAESYFKRIELLI